MKVIDPGHKYSVHTLDGDVNDIIFFVKREGEGYPGNVGHYPGTNIQEVLRVCIDRIKYLDQHIPCIENKAVLKLLRNSIILLEQRAASRHGRTLVLVGANIEDAPICRTCGHIGCEGGCRESHHRR